MGWGMTRHRTMGVPMLWLFLLALVCQLGLSSAHAQTPQEIALARSLFEEGVALADSADWSGAADRFARAYAIKPTAGIAFNYASALIELGKLVEASELLRAVARDPAASDALRAESEQKLASIQSRIAYLTVHVTGDYGPKARVSLDEHDLPKVAWGVASPIDPGSHSVRLLVGDTELDRKELTLAEAERSEVTLSGHMPTSHETSAPSVALVPVPNANHSEHNEARRPLHKNWMLWTGVGLVVAGGVVAAVLLTRDGGTETEPPIRGNANPPVVKW